MSERGVGSGSAGIHQGCNRNPREAEWGHKRGSLGIAWGFNRCKNECVGAQQGFRRDRAITKK
eukprot:15461196-Alexandrium_andersonii.AAC.1